MLQLESFNVNILVCFTITWFTIFKASGACVLNRTKEHWADAKHLTGASCGEHTAHKTAWVGDLHLQLTIRPDSVRQIHYVTGSRSVRSAVELKNFIRLGTGKFGRRIALEQRSPADGTGPRESLFRLALLLRR